MTSAYVDAWMEDGIVKRRATPSKPGTAGHSEAKRARERAIVEADIEDVLARIAKLEAKPLPNSADEFNLNMARHSLAKLRGEQNVAINNDLTRGMQSPAGGPLPTDGGFTRIRSNTTVERIDGNGKPV